ncbi:hypothetical protein [Pectinatus haikarae]|uniref:Uncharacterized protein n=1 Tax=Pectinatus haikarae TaxID=349096 RepID=A0ABT9Y870_9FIRM|nr:hypothetical protein [Pectinatus haikarae]MDQ0204037.1 hypothetical protein [Pectinatus haikarae]
MVPRIEKIARTAGVMTNYAYTQTDMQGNDLNRKKKKNPPSFKKMLHTAMEKTENDAYKVEINAQIR